MPTDEQRQWLSALLEWDPGTLGSDVASPASAAPAAQALPGHRGKPKKPAKTSPSKPLSDYGFMVLVDGLEKLADRSVLQLGQVPEMPAGSGERLVDEALGQAKSVVELWNVPLTLLSAQAIWLEAETSLRALLTQAAQQGFDRAIVDKSFKRVDQITTFLGNRLAHQELTAREKEIGSPEIDEAAALRKLKQMESGLNAFQANLQQIRRLAKEDSKLSKAAEAIELYYSVTEAKDKLAAFQRSEWKDRVKTIGELTIFMTGVAKDTVEAHGRIAIKLAERAGNKVLAEQLAKKLEPLKKITKIFALYDAYKSTLELIEAIEKGDEKAIAEAGFKVASAAIGVAEAFGAVSATGAAAATGVAFIIWAEVDVILSVAKLHRWGRMYTALQAVKSAVADAKKIAPKGRKMAAAASLVLESQDVQDSAGAAALSAYEKEADRWAEQVAKDLRTLAQNHFERKDLASVGGYPDLMKALGEPARTALGQAFMGIIPSDPHSLSEAFSVIMHGMKDMATTGDKLYGEAGGAS